MARSASSSSPRTAAAGATKLTSSGDGGYTTELERLANEALLANGFSPGKALKQFVKGVLNAGPAPYAPMEELEESALHYLHKAALSHSEKRLH